MKKIIISLLIYLLSAGVSFAAAEMNTLQLCWGNASFMRAGWNNWLNLSSKQPMVISPGDKIRVGEKSYAELTLSDESKICIKDNSLLVFSENSLMIQVGEVWLHLTRQKTGFKITTPVSSCTILGTVLNIFVDNFGKTRFRVIEGIASVRASEDTRKRQLVLQKGMMATIAEKMKTPDRPQNFDPAQARNEIGAVPLPSGQRTRAQFHGY